MGEVEAKDLVSSLPSTGSREKIGIIVSVILMIACMLFTVQICWVGYLNRTFPDIMLVIVVLFPLTALAWFYMGLINKERRDVLSAIVGDSGQEGILTTILSALAARRKG